MIVAMIPTAFHIMAGSIALLAGTGALMFRKGGPRHARWGTWFFGSMLAMAGTGAGLAGTHGDGVTATVGIFTIYLLVTSRMTARNRSGVMARSDAVGLLVTLGCAVAQFNLGWQIANSPTRQIGIYTPEVPYVFGILAGFAALLDLNALIRRTLSAQQRTARHLWRMCVAFFLAASSLFLGQQDDVFWFMAGSPLLFIPPVTILAAMLFWIVSTRLSPVSKRQAV